MKKKLSTAIIAVMFVISANAQFKIGASVNTGMPLGDFAKISNLGIGLTAFGKYMVTEKIALGLQVGTIGFGEKDNNGIKTTINPITGLFNYYLLTNKFRPYFGTDLGYYRVKTKTTVLNTTISSSSAKFGLAPMFGLEYGLTEKLFFNSTIKYNIVFTDGGSLPFWGINLGVTYEF